jgi:hypothetical protein
MARIPDAAAYPWAGSQLRDILRLQHCCVPAALRRSTQRRVPAIKSKQAPTRPNNAARILLLVAAISFTVYWQRRMSKAGS